MRLLLLVLALAKSPFVTSTNADHDQAISSFAEDILPSVKPSSTTPNGTGFVRGQRSADDVDDGVWASAPIHRLDSREKQIGPFWANRGRREMEELLEAIYASIPNNEGTESSTDPSSRLNRDSFPTPFDELRSMMRLTPHSSSFFGSLLKSKLRPPTPTGSDYETLSNRSRPDDVEGFELTSGPWADRARRRMSSKEVPDPFLANRGRATDEEDQVLANMVRGVDDTDTFWPNRGREVGDEETFWPNRGREVRDEETFWPNRGREVRDEDTFWPNRGRGVRDEDTFWPNRGREVRDEDTFWPNRGRDVEAPDPFYPNRGRGLKDEDPFWPNRGRDVQDVVDPFWPNRGRTVNNVPFWAKRARSVGGVAFKDLTDEAHGVASALKQRVRSVGGVAFKDLTDEAHGVASALKQRVRMRDVLYAELPTWIPLERRQAGLTGIASKDDPFWISRGRRAEPEDDTRLRRGLKNSLTREETFYPARGRRGLRETLSSEDQFWPLRGRRGLKESLSTEEHFWPLRGRRGLKDSLSAEEHFWPVRGKKGLRETLTKDDHFWPVRGKKSGDIEQVWRGRRIPTESTATRALGNLQDPNFWPVRGKRPSDAENAEDEAFWDALEKRSATKKNLAGKTSKESVGK